MSNIHLLVLIHGMWGHPGHLAELHRIAEDVYSKPTEDGTILEVLRAETNAEKGTYDGIDWGGERVAQEVREKIEALEKGGNAVTKISITGYSQGGLVARYLVGILYQQGFFDKVTPVNFNTIATPHIGLLRYPSFVSSVFHTLGPRLLSRTGEQFYCTDKWSTSGRPLLVVMADPDRIFFKGLKRFQHVRIYANAINDITVPYMTAAIELEDPFAEYESNGVEVVTKDEHPYVIASYTLPDTPPIAPPTPRRFSRAWFRKATSKPLLPPALQFRFPLNLVVYALMPVLIPTFVSLVIVNFTVNSHSSRARIRLLEQDASYEQKLVNVLARLEREVEGAVVDLIDEDDPRPTEAFSLTHSHQHTHLHQDEESGRARAGSIGSTAPKPKLTILKAQSHPILTSDQKQIVHWLNRLPQLQKELAFFEDVRNAHAIIVKRDVKRFALHEMGEGVVRHWAEHLVV